MHWILIAIVVCAAAGCVVTITPIHKSKLKSHQVIHKTKYPKTDHPETIVDSDWMFNYRQLEIAHGDYRISDDEKAESVGGGKYRVTPAMLQHFRDLTQVPVNP